MSEAKSIPADVEQGKFLPPDGGKRLKPSPTEDVFFKICGDEVDGLFDYFEIRASYLDGPPLHIHPSQHETFHVIEGNLTVQVGEQIVEAHPGDFVFIPKGVVHAYTNLIEGTVVRAVGNFVPGGFDKFLTDLHAYLKTASPPDPKIVAEISAKHNQVFVGPPLAVLMGLRQAHA